MSYHTIRNKIKRMTGILTAAAIFSSVLVSSGRVNAAEAAKLSTIGPDLAYSTVLTEKKSTKGTAKAGKWHKSAKGWWYGYPDGSYENSGWKKISGKWYYFDKAGYMASNEWRDGYWINRNGTQTYKYRARWEKWEYGYKDEDYIRMRYCDSSGWRAENGWQKIDGKWYFFRMSCAIKGHVYDSGKIYSLGDDGALKDGWVKDDGKWYYSGAPRMGWKKISGKWYYFDYYGVMATEPVLWKDKWYVFEKNGAMKTPLTSLSKAKVGDQVYFGKYEQDANPNNGKERIIWRVMDEKDGKLLLMSENLLDTCFDYPGVWETCKEREFLNGEFLSASFSEAERAKISLTTLKNEQYIHLGDTGETRHNAQSDTEDYVFLFSIDEICKYFGITYDDIYETHIQCFGAGTKYYYTKGYTDHEEGLGIPWRLRTTPNFPDYPYGIGYYGNLTWVGVGDIAGEGLRPVMWVTP